MEMIYPGRVVLNGDNCLELFIMIYKGNMDDHLSMEAVVDDPVDNSS
jgi:hypothetical protein